MMKKIVLYLQGLTVNLRLGLLAALAIAMILMVGLTTFPQIQRMAESFNDFYEYPHAVTNLSRDMKSTLVEFRREMRNAIADHDPALRGQAVEEMANLERRFLNDLSQLRPIYRGQVMDLDDAERLFRNLVIYDRELLQEFEENQDMQAVWAKTRSSAPGNPGEAVADALDKIFKSAEQRAAQANETQQAIFRSVSFEAIILLGIAFFVTVSVSYILARSINRPLQRIRDNIIDLSEGKLDCVLPYQNMNNEAGDIARAMATFQKVYRDMETQRWIKTQEAQINGALQNFETIQEFAQEALSLLCPLIGAQHGLFYVESDGQLKMQGRYGFRERKQLNNQFAIGEGLVGQCAVERQPITITDPPADYIQINSGLGSAVPAVIAVLPVMQGECLQGVVELAALRPFSDREMALIDDLVPSFATKLMLLERGLKTQALLEETQEQAMNMEKQAAQLEEQSVEMEAQQAELASTEEWYRSILTSAPDGALVVDSGGTVVVSNTRAEELFGYEPGKMNGLSVEKLVPMSVRNHHGSLLNSFFVSGETRRMGGKGSELKAIRADGSEFSAEIGLSQLPDVGGRGLCAYASVQDVTERKQAEEIIKGNEKRFRSLFESSRDALFILRDGKYIDCNQSALTLFGLSDREELFSAKPGVLAPEIQPNGEKSADYAARMFAQAMDQGSVEFEWTIKRADEELRPTEIMITRVDYGDGYALYSSVRDITARKEAEYEIKFASLMSDSALELTNAGYWRIDYVNPDYYISSERAMAIFGEFPKEDMRYSMEEWLSRISDADPDEAKETARLYQAALDAELKYYDAVYPYKRPADGKVAWLHAVGRIERDETGALLLMYGVVQDVTGIKEAEFELELAKANAEAASDDMMRVIEATQAGTFQANMVTGLVEINERWAEILGYTKADLDPVTLEEWQELLHPEDAVIVNSALAAHFADSSVRYNLDLRMKHKDGHYVWISTTGAVTKRTDDGQPEIVSGNHLDISERKASEVALQEAKVLAESATKAKGEFLASMSHEIRTPMNGITGMADLLSQSELDDDQKHMVRTIRDSGNSLITIINDILDFSKIEAGKLDIEEVSLSVADIVEGVATTLAPGATKKGIRIHTFVDPKIPETITGDPTRIRQILFNLAGNAVKFSDGKDVQVRAELVQTLSDDSDDRKVKIRYELIDQGIGISPENQSKLFQAFAQAEMSTTRRFGGTGLGLAICRRLVDMMGGSIGVESEEGRGSTFWVELSCDAAGSGRIHEKQRDLDGLNVLLVGSTEPRSGTLEAYASHWGARVEHATEISAAVTKLNKTLQKDEAYDAIVIDFNFNATAQQDAIETLRNAQDSDKKVRIPLILLEDFQKRDARIREGDIITVDANPLMRYRFVTAVAVAAGRASPQPAPANDGPVVEKKVALSVEAAAAAGELILLAEDNPTNQDVIRRQLNMLGYTCEIADDGKQALAAWQTGKYAILLTDCHMPEMDGYELTGSIREAEEGTDQRCPIIAITANALQGEAERCFAAGMDDYLSKPVAMPALLAALKKWMPTDNNNGEVLEKLKAETQPEAVEVPAENDSEEGTPVNDRAIKDMFGDDDETFREILQGFVEPSVEIVRDMLSAHEGHDADEIKSAAHKLKSSSRSIGADKLADICTALEAAGKSRDWDQINILAPQVEEQMKKVEIYIQSL